MNSMKKFYCKTIKYDLINKFIIKNSKEIPKIDKITLNFYCRTKPGDFSMISSCVLALQLISHQDGVLTKALFPSLAMRFRKGFPIGCKLIIKKENLYYFLSRLVQEIYPSSKTCITMRYTDMNEAFSFNLDELFHFEELEENYNFFKDLNPLNVTIVVANAKSAQELEFLLTSLKVPMTED